MSRKKVIQSNKNTLQLENIYPLFILHKFDHKNHVNAFISQRFVDKDELMFHGATGSERRLKVKRSRGKARKTATDCCTGV